MGTSTLLITVVSERVPRFSAAVRWCEIRGDAYASRIGRVQTP